MNNLGKSIISRLFALLFGCATTACTTVTVRHDPLYREQSHTSEIRATAENTRVGIATISIEVTAGAMTDCSEFNIVPGTNTTSIIPCRVGATQTTNTCRFSSNPALATCSVTVPIKGSTLVSYVVKVVSGSGQTTTTPEVAYGGGELVPARIARPVYWHRQAPRSAQIDLGLFPDSDYKGFFPPPDPYRRFTDNLDTILRGAFFNDTDAFARAYTGDRQFFNLWAGPFGANARRAGANCSRTFSGDALAVSAVMDGSGILHRDTFRDCASLTAGGGGTGTIEATATDPAWLLVHEGAHFLFQLSDEYGDDGGYDANTLCPNVYSSQQSCQIAAPSVGATAGQCSKVGATGFWRIATANETMSDRVLASDFRDDAARCVRDRITNCSNGVCY